MTPFLDQTIWATWRGQGVPCLWGTRQDAIEGCDRDEEIIQVRVSPMSAVPLCQRCLHPRDGMEGMCSVSACRCVCVDPV